MNEYSLIGKRLPRIDAKEKVTGKALYTDDLSMGGMLYGMILRSPRTRMLLSKSTCNSLSRPMRIAV